MTKQQVLDEIAALIPVNANVNADVRAQTLLARAVLRVGRMKGVHWNREDVTIAIEGGKSSYKVGVDILGQYADMKNVQVLWRTDVQRPGIPILDIEDFNLFKRGNSASGPPEYATIHSSDETLEIYPTPDTNYSLFAYIKKKITKFEEIPDEYHDVLIDEAVASADPRTALARAQRGTKEIAGDSLTEWSGNVVPIARHVGRTGLGVEVNSQNLRG